MSTEPDPQLATEAEVEAFEVLRARHEAAVSRRCGHDARLLDAVFEQAWIRRRHLELVDDSALPWLEGICDRFVRARRRRRVVAGALTLLALVSGGIGAAVAAAAG